jgi:CRISPR-associated protein Csm1
MNPLREQVYLAALLHDIGKFYQRADEKLFEEGAKNHKCSIGEVSFNMAQSICPPNMQGGFGYHHVVWTSQFFENSTIKEVLNKVPGIKVNPYQDDGQDRLVNLACNHHRPQSLLQQIIQVADWWSAGIDRTKKETLEKEIDEKEPLKWGKERYKKIPLYSLFNILNDADGNFAHSISSLNIDNSETIFPKKILSVEDGISQLKYRKLWGHFVEEFKQLPTDSFEGFSETLIALLKKYTWCIPSNTNDMADVSLYDHLKTTAAFAACFYDYLEANRKLDQEKLSFGKGEFPVMLLGCDISGIQRFIYNISGTKAATSLKGRSFYLQLLIDSIIQRIIAHDSIKATPGHVVYSSGGKVFILLPNTESVNKAIFDDIRPTIEKEMWDEHRDAITLNLDCVPFAYRDNSIDFEFDGKKSFGALWKLLNDKLTLRKAKKMEKVIKNTAEFFEVIPDGGDVISCAVSGLNLKENEIFDLNTGNKVSLSDAKSNEDIVPVTESVSDQKELGLSLKDADYLIMFRDHKTDATYLNNHAHAHIRIAGVDSYLFDKSEIAKEESEFRKITSADVSRVIQLNQTHPLIIGLKGKKVGYGFQFYGGNEQAFFRDNAGNIEEKPYKGILKRKRSKTFEELTQVQQGNAASETYLGILRMDVDNLGNLFINGIPESKRSFSTYSTLSFYLDMFFSGYLNHIRNDFKYNEDDKERKCEYKYRDWVNILYSGGDDVFAVGRWDRIIEFANDIQKEFKRFTGRNDITLSAGVAIVHNKFPIAKAAQITGEAESKAKNFPETAPLDEKLKNAICFFGETISWHKEFDYVSEMKDKFFELIKNEGMSRGLLQKLMLFADTVKRNEEHIRNRETGKVDPSYAWNAAYYLKRYLERYNKKENVIALIKKLIQELQVELLTQDNRKYYLIALAARWAEQELKLEKLNS